MGKVATLSIDDSLGGARAVVGPDWDDVLGALDGLNGAERSQVGLLASAGHQMIIGGGPAGFVTSFERDDEVFSLLGDGVGRDTRWIICGQGAEFPGDEVVPRAAVVQAARCFFESGERDEGLRWRRY